MNTASIIEIITAAVLYSGLQGRQASPGRPAGPDGISFEGPLGKIAVWEDGTVEHFDEWPCIDYSAVYGSSEWVAADPASRTDALAKMQARAIAMLK